MFFCIARFMRRDGPRLNYAVLFIRSGFFVIVVFVVPFWVRRHSPMMDSQIVGHLIEMSSPKG